MTNLQWADDFLNLELCLNLPLLLLDIILEWLPSTFWPDSHHNMGSLHLSLLITGTISKVYSLTYTPFLPAWDVSMTALDDLVCLLPPCKSMITSVLYPQQGIRSPSYHVHELFLSRHGTHAS